MIYEVEGDILMSRAEVIAQGVSINDPMNRGLARKLQEKFPSMREQYEHWCEDTEPEPGDIWLWQGNGKTKILNLIIAEAADPDLGRASRPNKIAINRAFKAMNKLVVDERLSSIAMAKIGGGKGGIDWLEVRGLLHAHLSDMLIPLFVYATELDGMLASEPGM
jgi:O-acetyl-ADP-ribose deacetylase (regulator of RNase III)